MNTFSQSMGAFLLQKESCQLITPAADKLARTCKHLKGCFRLLQTGHPAGETCKQ